MAKVAASRQCKPATPHSYVMHSTTESMCSSLLQRLSIDDKDCQAATPQS